MNISKKISLILFGCFYICIPAFAQRIKAIKPTTQKNKKIVEIPSGSTINVYYLNPENYSITESVFEVFLIGDDQMVKNQVKYNIVVDKVDHLNDPDWGVSTLCWGLCQPPATDGYANSCEGYPKVIEATPEKDVASNSVSVHFDLRGKYAEENSDHEVIGVKTSDEFKARVTIAPVNSSQGNTLMYNVNINRSKAQALDVIYPKKIVILQSPNGECTISMDGRALNNGQLTIADLNGNVIYSQELLSASSLIKIPVCFNKGVKIFNITSGGKQIFSQKVNI